MHAGLPLQVAMTAAARLRIKGKLRNSKASGHGRIPPKLRDELSALYQPFLDRFYTLIAEHRIAVTPCEHQGTRFLDHPDARNANATTSPTSMRHTRAAWARQRLPHPGGDMTSSV
jgi:hypothetical protein